VKIRSGLLLGRVRRLLALQAKTLFLALERASIGTSDSERRPSVADDALGRCHLLLRAALLGFEREDAQALANATKLGSGEIVSALEPGFEASPLGVLFALSPCRFLGSLLASSIERRRFTPRLSFGFADCSRIRVDLLAPERHERLEGVALLQRWFLSAVTRG
jgi:hypothetical protein